MGPGKRRGQKSLINLNSSLGTRCLAPQVLSYHTELINAYFAFIVSHCKRIIVGELFSNAKTPFLHGQQYFFM